MFTLLCLINSIKNRVNTRKTFTRIGKLSFSLIFVVSLLGSYSVNVKAASEVTFSGEELLGRPTDNSITINIVPDADIEYYYEYGTTSGIYTAQTNHYLATADEPDEVVITGLSADTRYYYRMIYDGDGDVDDGDFITRDEHTFHTQRAEGEAFTFTITSDSHVNIMLGNSATWQQTMTNVVSDNPDFHIDLGDTFAMDSVSTVAGAETAYLYQRQFFDLVGNSAPIFLTAGNHEQQEGWHLDDTTNPALAPPVLSINAQKKYYMNPVPDGFYTGNTDTYAYLSDDQLIEDYYAWTWGDALFVFIDPYWYTTTKPYTGNTGGGESSDTGSGDRWDWTLGQDQFEWLKQTLENSDAKYKFIFSHHMTGGSDDYVRGGANPAHLVEWGGDNETGTAYEWETKRPGWGSDPIRQILIDNHVSAFFHGHDHQYAYEERDGIVYQSLPAAGFSGSGFNIYTTGSGYTIQAMASPGHLRVTVNPTETTVDYVATTGGTVNYSYTIEPNPSGPTHVLTTAVNPPEGGTTDPEVGEHTYDEGDVVSITADPNEGYAFDHWGGACTGTGGCQVTMDGDKTVTAYFSALPSYTLTTSVDPAAGGTINPSAGVHTYYEGDIVTVTATRAAGYFFSHWSGNCSETGICQVTMNGNKTVTANFIEAASILGDVNGNEVVDSTDALIILSGDVGINISQFCPVNCGDVNGDGKANSTDALIILSYDVGISVSFPIGETECPTDVTCAGCNP